MFNKKSYLNKLYYFPLCFIIFLLFFACGENTKPKSEVSSEKSVKSDQNEKIGTIKEKTKDFIKHEGYFTFYWDSQAGKLWLQIDKLDTEFLYFNTLTNGVGSNDLLLDRGSLYNPSRIVKFLRVGPKILMIQPNYKFRAVGGDQYEVSAVEESFAKSVLWQSKVEAEENGRVLVDATDLFLKDAININSILVDEENKQGDYRFNPELSNFFLPRTKNFSDNTEIEAILTFTGEPEIGSSVTTVVPNPEFITVNLHHSFIRLPDKGYKKRKFDPRAGYNYIDYMDFASVINEPIRKRFIERHRLKKKDPSASESEPVEPIVYYVDRGAPKEIRKALLEGAQWWNQAFKAAGYKDAFRVELLPEGFDPMDSRYNVIQWVHRSTRGWSYGVPIVDPRTGEIIKATVTLGSSRHRHDYLIAEGLLAPYENGKPVSNEMKEMALARIKQLAAHEVGHTLGLAHNFVGSAKTFTTVMDYPHPLIKLSSDGDIDLTDAYDDKIGTWDKVAIEYGYQDFPEGKNEEEALNTILDEAIGQGYIVISDDDARPTSSAHPTAHLWDNGQDIISELNHIMGVREKALNRFSENTIRKGLPMAKIEDVLVPIYLLHRYQTEAVSKLLGGLNYTYALRGDGQTITEIVPPEQQRMALEAMLNTIKPEALALPEKLISKIPPRPLGYPRTTENFKTRTALTFDPFAASEVASFNTIKFILNPQRAARLVEYHTRNPNNPGLIEVIDKIVNATWKSSPPDEYHAEIQRIVNNIVLDSLMNLANDENASRQVRSIAYLKLDDLKNWLKSASETEADESQRAHYLFTISQISLFQENPNEFRIYKPVENPPGPPIGQDICAFSHPISN